MVIAVAGLVFFNMKPTATPEAASSDVVSETSIDDFAQCLADAGAKFYGAFWCPHCQEQKALFKKSEKLPYVECSLPDGQGQTQECADEGITGYPTWKFADGTELGGVQQFAKLAEKTNCVAP